MTKPHAYDPELAALLPSVPLIDLSDPAAARETAAGLFEGVEWPPTNGLRIEDRHVGHDPQVAVRLYVPEERSAALRPGVLVIHGGGFVVGDLRFEHATSIRFARELGAAVVSVDYRLAPEHPYPAALDDCVMALQWLHGNAEELGVDPTRIAIYGLSAGGGLAAATALRARDDGGPPVCFQLLEIPELDDRLTSPSMLEYADTPMWDNQQAHLSWQAYLGDGYRASEVPYYAAPARATELVGLPRTAVSVCQFDPLRDEGIAYAQRLASAGVPVELRLWPGTFHGSVLFEAAGISQRMLDERIALLRRHLGASG